VKELRDRTMQILGDLVGFPTVTSESNLPLIDYAVSSLEKLDASIHLTYDLTGLKANLLATIGPQVDGGVVLSGHTDVVPADEADWTGAPFVAMRRHGRIYGRGTADMKGFLACALAMAPTFANSGLVRPVHLALTFDEEVGCHGAPLLIHDLLASGFMPEAAIVGEPTGMGIVTAHKGCYEYTTAITGIEGHGSQPQRAVNAVQHGARFVAGLMDIGAKLCRDAPPSSVYDPPHTTISVGSMHGGTARNIVAGECVIEWEMRPVRSADARRALAEIAALEEELGRDMRAVSPDASIATITEGAVDGLEHVDDSPAVLLVADLLGESERHTAAFGTEAGLYQMAGIPAVVCGPGAIEVAHRPDEYVGLDQLERCLTMMRGLVKTLSTSRHPHQPTTERTDAVDEPSG
jgi:acetylornithine deacetylase